MSATLRDVAKMAGVSIGTVSQALNNRPNVSQETRSRVLDAAMAVGYQIREADMEGAEVGVSVIGMLAKHDYGLGQAVNSFYSHVERGVEMECHRRGLNLMVGMVEVDECNRPLAWPPMVREPMVDGLLLLGACIDEEVDQIQRRKDIPLVLIDGYAPGFPYDNIVIDNAEGAHMAMKHLLDAGHRHIGLIGTNERSHPGVLVRRETYLSALHKRGIPDSYIEDGKLGRVEARQCTLRLLQRCPQVTAIFAASDDVALGVIDAVREIGGTVPETVSVVGFDNIDLAKEVVPNLTTVNVPKAWLGVLGVRQLIDRIQRPEQPRVNIAVSTQFVVRESTRSLVSDP
ncbi:MAG: LacI family DNA-binding transcriptional regulator [Chloroflexota bacterium]